MALLGGYMRVSSKGDRDPDRWLTVPHQREAIERWCRDHDHRLVDLRQDIDVSGASKNRPNLEELVVRVESGDLAGIVVAKLDRFSRWLPYGVQIIERIDEAGGLFVAAADGFDLRTDSGRLQFHVMLSFADYELRRFRTNWRKARETLILERGQHWGPAVPLGYRRDADGRLAIDPETADLVRELYVRRSAGAGLTELARWLDGLGARTWRGGRPTARWVGDLVRSPVYLGWAYAGSLCNEHAHPPLVDRVTWERGRRARAPKPSQGSPTLLSGLVRCRACRHVMGAAWSQTKAGRVRAYRCNPGKASGRCPRPAFALERVLLELVEPIFWDLVGGDLVASPTEADDASARVQELERERERRVFARDQYRDDPDIQGALPPRAYADGLGVRQRRVDEIDRAIGVEVARRPAIAADATTLRLQWPDLEIETRRRMLHAAIGAVVVSAPSRRRDHSVLLCHRARLLRPEDLPSDLPRPGRNPRPLVAFPAFDDPSCPWVSLGEPGGEDPGDGLPCSAQGSFGRHSAG
jgi:DNA invertase Pin-like site-specific DNA recombinase